MHNFLFCLFFLHKVKSWRNKTFKFVHCLLDDDILLVYPDEGVEDGLVVAPLVLGQAPVRGHSAAKQHQIIFKTPVLYEHSVPQRVVVSLESVEFQILSAHLTILGHFRFF